MGVTAFLLHRSPWTATGVSLVVYAGLLIVLRTFRNPDIQRVLQVVPFLKRKNASTPSGD